MINCGLKSDGWMSFLVGKASLVGIGTMVRLDVVNVNRSNCTGEANLVVIFHSLVMYMPYREMNVFVVKLHCEQAAEREERGAGGRLTNIAVEAIFPSQYLQACQNLQNKGSDSLCKY